MEDFKAFLPLNTHLKVIYFQSSKYKISTQSAVSKSTTGKVAMTGRMQWE